MKDRLVTLACALGAFAIFYSIFIGGSPEETARVSRPLSTEAGANGYLGLQRWLESQRVAVVALRRRYDWLDSPDATGPAHGNVLITTMPHERAMRKRELDALKDWVRAGNTVFVAAGLLDTPEWAFAGSPPDLRPLELLGSLSGLTDLLFELCPADAEEEEADAAPDGDAPRAEPGDATPVFALPPYPSALDLPRHSVLRPSGRHPLTTGVGRVVAVSEYPADEYCVPSPDDGGVLALMSNEAAAAALWLRRMGRGALLVSGYGSILTNKILGEADNLRLLANVLRAQLAADGVVYLDDLHQGVSSVYDADAFYGDARLHATFWWIVGLWILYVIGSTRLHGGAPPPAAVDESELTVALGNLFARSVGDSRAGERMFHHFFNDLRRSLGRPEDGLPVWDWLRTTTSVARERIDRVARLHARVARGEDADLVELHNALASLRRELS